jgi:hypothetical protein
MKIAWTRMKGVCLLLLGLATTGGGRGLAADIATQNFATLADSTSAASSGKSDASPFKDESAAAPAAGRVAAATPAYDAGFASACDPFQGAPGRVWFRGEYLHWWTSGAYLPPMVSTLNTQTGTTYETVFGDRNVYSGDHSGYLVNFGAWLDCAHHWGLEADYFDISGKQCNYDSGFTDGFVDGVAHPIVRIVSDPAATPNAQADYVGYGGYYVGRITVQTNNYFQSAGITLRRELRAWEWSTCNRDVNWLDPSARTFRLDAIGGYRFARLIDTVNEEDDSFEYNANQPNWQYEYNYVNNYRTVNNFNGGELGFNCVYTHGRWSLDVVGKAALGANNQDVSMYNQQTTDVSNARGIGTAPILSNPSPQQEFTRNRFSAIPELAVTAGYQLTDHVKVTAGYDLLYWTAVVRAADQIAVDPANGLPYGTVVGNYSTLPAFSWNESHLLAQGLHLGAELRY